MIQSARLTAAMIGLVLLTAPALGLLAYRNAETSILLAGLAAILGVIVVATLMADSLTRPLAQVADAIEALAREKSAALIHEGNKQRVTVVALEQYAQRKHTFIAAVESANDPVPHQTRDGAIATGNEAVERLRMYAASESIGNTIDIIIPSDRREQQT